jgi:hypothetical protein
MSNRFIQTFLFLMALIAFNVPCYGQQVDYKNLKIGDVLPNGDSLENIRFVGDSENLKIGVYLLRNTRDGSFKTTLAYNDKVKHFDGDVCVVEKFNTIVESLTNGDITIYDKEWKQTGKLNTRSDFGWKENWTDAGISPIYPYFLSDQYILLHQLNSLKIINKSGDVVFSQDYTFDEKCSNFYYTEVQYLESGKVFISVICNYNVDAYFLLVDTSPFKVKAQTNTQNIFPPDRFDDNFHGAFYIEKSGNLYISDSGCCTFITNFSRSFLMKMEISSYVKDYDPIEIMGDTYLYSLSDKVFKKYSLETGEKAGSFNLNLIAEKLKKDIYYTNKYVVGENFIYIIVEEQLSSKNRKRKVNGVIELSFDMKYYTYHPIADTKQMEGKVWEKVHKQVGLIKK